MTITLKPEQEQWLAAQVAEGVYPSIEAAVRALIDERMASGGDADDFAWAKPFVDEALDDVKRGDVLSLDEHRARRADKLARNT